MHDSTALLISRDASLITKVDETVHSIDRLRLRVVDGVDPALTQFQRQDTAVILVHLTEDTEATEVCCLLRAVAARRRPVATLLIGDDGQSEQGLALLRQGAVDYLCRPLDLARLLYLLDTLTLRCRYAGPQPAPEPSHSLGEHNPFLFDPIAPLGRILEQVQVIAPQDTTLLLTGETGTGKTRLARLIHELSLRRGEPFRDVNCGALTVNLIESELFGHVRGAFTGAERDRTGKFADAGRGTLLLDEIDALTLNAQAKLLRALEERLFEPVGSNKSQPVRARIIAASNRPLEGQVAAGQFRSDLYYRLNVVAFYLPPLREQVSLIRRLVNKFIAEYATRNGRPVRAIAGRALQALEDYSWPGNVRELRNAIERAVALCPGTEIQLADLPDVVRAAGSEAGPEAGPRLIVAPVAGTSAPLVKAKEDAEAARIAEALRRNNNNRLRAAVELGISRMTLYKKLHRYGLMGVT